MNQCEMIGSSVSLYLRGGMEFYFGAGDWGFKY